MMIEKLIHLKCIYCIIHTTEVRGNLRAASTIFEEYVRMERPQSGTNNTPPIIPRAKYKLVWAVVPGLIYDVQFPKTHFTSLYLVFVVGICRINN